MCERGSAVVTLLHVDQVMTADEIPNCGHADCWFCSREPDWASGFHVAYFDAEEQLHIAFCPDSRRRETFCADIERRLRQQTQAGQHPRYVLRRAERHFRN